MKKYLVVFSLAIIFSLSSNDAFSQKLTPQNNFGFQAGISLPSGINVSMGVPGGSTSGLSYAGGVSGASFLMALTNQLQFEAGIGLVTLTSDGAEDRSAWSLAVGGKYFTRPGADVSPYIHGGISYSDVPGGFGPDDSGNLFSFQGAFGAQAFINDSKTFAIFIEMGLSYNTLTLETESGGIKTSSTASNLFIGSSQVGGCVYF